MRKFKFLILLSVLAYPSKNIAQTLYKEGVIKLQKSTYVVSNLQRNFISITKQNTSTKVSSGSRIKNLERVEFAEGVSLNDVFNQVFSEARRQALRPEKNMICTIKIDNDGNVLAVTFLLHNYTVITPQEIESLENLIKAKVKIKIPSSERNSGEFAPLTQNILFSRVFQK